MGEISAARMKRLVSYTGGCNAVNGEHYVSAEVPYTYEDVVALQDTYYRGKGDRLIHMSDVPGFICWKSMGSIQNSVLAGLIDDTCEDVLKGEDAEAKCEALYKTVDHYTEDSTIKWVLGGLATLLGTWLVFGPGMSLWKWIADKFSKPPTGGTPSEGSDASSRAAEGSGGSETAKSRLPDPEPVHIPMPSPEQVAEVGFWAAAAALMYKAAQGARHILNTPVPASMFIIVPPIMGTDGGLGTGYCRRDPTGYST